jgi:hypothetical protein
MQTAGYQIAGAASGSDNHYYYSIDVGLVHFVVLDTMPYLDLGSPLVASEQVSQAGLSYLEW